MAGLYLDENVSLALEDDLRRRGHFVTNTVVEKRLGAPDPRLLLEAAERGWTFVSHNRRDFRLLHDAWLTWANAWAVYHGHAGIVILERVVGQSPTEAARLIDELLRAPATSLVSALYDWKPATGWSRFPD